MKSWPARVFITGASSGLGTALARAYAARGAMLGLTGRRTELLAEIANQLPGHTSTYSLDVRDAVALRNAAADFMQRFGTPDVVIANAGISVGTLTEHAEDLPVFQEVMDTNVMGVVNTFHPFVAAMRERQQGSLVGIASIAGFRGLPGASAYSASKAAVMGYLESLRVELHGSGVTVTTLCPGYIRTPMTAKNPYPMPFILDPDDAARRMIRAIDARSSGATIPWQVGIGGYFLKRLPDWLYDWAFARAGRKPRRA